MVTIELIEISEAHRAAITVDPSTLARLTDFRVPSGWPIYKEIFARPTVPDWPLFLFVDPNHSTIIGSGGFLNEPDMNGFVQIGYEVAPEFRGHGFAAQAMLQVLAQKPDAKLVASVAASNQPSISVLRKLGFTDTGRTLKYEAEELSLWTRVRTGV